MDTTYRIETEITIGNRTIRRIAEAPSKAEALELHSAIHLVNIRVDEKGETRMEDALTASVNAS